MQKPPPPALESLVSPSAPRARGAVPQGCALLAYQTDCSPRPRGCSRAVRRSAHHVAVLPAPAGHVGLEVAALLAYLDADLPEVFSYSPLCADGVGAQGVARVEERIATVLPLRDSLVDRMPWLE